LNSSKRSPRQQVDDMSLFCPPWEAGRFRTVNPKEKQKRNKRPNPKDNVKKGRTHSNTFKTNLFTSEGALLRRLRGSNVGGLVLFLLGPTPTLRLRDTTVRLHYTPMRDTGVCPDFLLTTSLFLNLVGWPVSASPTIRLGRSAAEAAN